MLDGVFATNGDKGVSFHAARRLTRDDVADVVAIVGQRIERLLQRRGVAATAEENGIPDAWSEDAPVLAGIAAASVQGRVALGPRAGARVQRCGEPPADAEPVTPGPCHAQWGGFDLAAGIIARAGQRDRLERLCRYALRPPIAEDRLRLDGEGHVRLTLRHPWADGTRHLQFDVELLERLAVLTRGPRSTWCCTTGSWRRARRGVQPSSRRRHRKRLKERPPAKPVHLTTSGTIDHHLVDPVGICGPI